MTLRIPNRTAQTGVYKTGSPDYVDVSSGTAVASMVTFSAKATDDSWADSDTVGVAITKDASNYKVWLASWDETNEYLELVTEEESVGTISDTAAVTVTAVLTQGTIEDTLNAAANAREVLTADRTYYVRTDGSDSNSGLVDSAGGAFLTIQKAIDLISNTLDITNKTVTIQVKDGTYTDPVVLKRYVASGAGNVVIQGNSGTPSNVLVSVTSNSCFSGINALSWTIKNLKVSTTTSGNCVSISGNCQITYSNIDFGACADSHLYCDRSGEIYCGGNYSISGSAAYHGRALVGGSLLMYNSTVTISGTPAFSNAFVQAAYGAVLNTIGMTFSGSATGIRYNVILNSVINTYGGGANYFPGNASGTTATGGQYA